MEHFHAFFFVVGSGPKEINTQVPIDTYIKIASDFPISFIDTGLLPIVMMKDFPNDSMHPFAIWVLGGTAYVRVKEWLEAAKGLTERHSDQGKEQGIIEAPVLSQYLRLL